jgi:tRNA1(Val) A37 N6-methylase TrmN6
MALFQQSVITKHLNAIDKKQLESKWIEYSAHFLNSSIQAQIRNLKEEQYQGEFLEDLFVKILGYTKAPQPNHNLITEQKNQTNSKKADGAILITDSKGFQTVRAVIELKGTDTTDLSKIETQAFGYKNNQPECVYVITSNFEKIRFYIENAVDFIEFNLFTLSRKDFDLLYCCLAYENIKANSPKHLKDESVSKESQITKQLYKDYSDFKRALYNNLVEKNPQIDKLLLFKKTQKLLDRFLFVFFAEDRQLVPTNLIRRINLEWENLKKARIPVSLYDRYKVYFEDLNTGAKVTLPAFGKKTGDAITAEFEIFAYNGGLFLPDEILDNVQIDDEILHKHSIILSDYDFDSDVDVNILGHIFENSLNEIDEIKSEIEGNVIDKTKTKRKKDGVFYTPKYITKYIVENTVGKLCEEKKAEFAIIDEEFAKGRKNRNKTTIQKLDSDLQSYRDWLLQITICDPACGSGAFLNQALEFLIQEHKYIDELQAQLFGSSIGFPGAELHILENNIYGVDLNDESVEIAKLSLWLRTAQKGRKLNSLNNNIKAGNSLIDDPAVAGDKAFSWEKEFPEVFAKGGFDVIIGNPPYVTSKGSLLNDLDKIYYKEKFETASYQIDLYILFIEKCFYLINHFGFSSLIVPNSWMNNSYLEPTRKFLIAKTEINNLAEMEKNTFVDANVDTVILTFSKVSRQKKTFLNIFEKNQFYNVGEINQNDWLKEEKSIVSIRKDSGISKIIKNIRTNSIQLIELSNIGRGVGVYHKRVGHTKELIALDPYQSNCKEDDTFVPYLRGRNVNFYSTTWNNNSFISYGNWLAEPRDIKFFEGERIILRQIPSKKLMVTLINEKFIIDQSVFIAKFKSKIKFSTKYILGVLGSNLMSFYFRFNFSEFDELFPKVKLEHFKSFPIKKVDFETQELFSDKVEYLLGSNKFLEELLQKFSTYFSKQYKIEKLSGKLEKWYELEFTAFIKELNKAIKAVGGVQLTKKDEFEWMDLFEENKKKALELKAEIDKTDKEIDQMVYALYGLTEEEIKIVEGVV